MLLYIVKAFSRIHQDFEKLDQWISNMIRFLRLGGASRKGAGCSIEAEDRMVSNATYSSQRLSSSCRDLEARSDHSCRCYDRSPCYQSGTSRFFETSAKRRVQQHPYQGSLAPPLEMYRTKPSFCSPAVRRSRFMLLSNYGARWSRLPTVVHDALVSNGG